jgi:ABC-type transport system substrate-binding protein
LNGLLEWLRGGDTFVVAQKVATVMGLRRGRIRGFRMVGLAALLSVVQGCGAVPPSPNLPSSLETASSSRVVPADRIVVGVHIGDDALGALTGFAPSDMPLFPALANGVWWDHVVRRFVYSGVYRLDDAGEPVEDLAAAPCTWTEDRLTIACRLRDARFHDGAPVTADDVAFTFELLASGACVERDEGRCIPNLERADATDPATVDFHLRQPDATFLTVALPDVLIESRSRIEESFDRFRAGSMGAEPAAVAAEAERINEALKGDSPDCSAVIADGETAVRALGLKSWNRAEFNLGPDDAFVPCGYAESLGRVLTEAATSLAREREGDRIGAIEASYRILDYHDELPVGSGPWKVVDIEAGRLMELEAFSSFYRGRPATSELEVRLIRTKTDAVSAVRDHAVDWLVQPFAGQAPYFLRDGLNGEEEGLTLNLYEAPSWFGMYYNVRPGALFSEAKLREAVELCIDKEETVAAASRDQFIAIQSPFLPSSWADTAELKTPSRDVEHAKALIREAGWRLGADGYYAKGGSRLSAVVPIRSQRPDRLAFLRLLEDQVKDCGMEITPQETSDMKIVLSWPQVVPGTDEPWDLAFNGLVGPPPDDPGLNDTIFLSDHVTSRENPEDDNLMGYKSEEVDDLLARARETYVLEDRARLYKQVQLALARDRPMLFAFAHRLVEARSNQITSTAGPLSTSSATWWWELERLVKNEPVQ